MTGPVPRLRIPVVVELAGSADAARILGSTIGLSETARALSEVAVGAARGEPWREMGRPLHQREALSRRQAGQAILLYRVLSDRLGSETSLRLTREVVRSATMRFLAWAIGPLSREHVAGLSEVDRDVLFRSIGARFFNADVRWVELSQQAIRLVVTHCLFPGLCGAAGSPEVAPLLCEGDAIYFERALGAELIRPETIASGGSMCAFEARWR